MTMEDSRERAQAANAGKEGPSGATHGRRIGTKGKTMEVYMIMTKEQLKAAIWEIRHNDEAIENTATEALIEDVIDRDDRAELAAGTATPEAIARVNYYR